MNHGDSCYGRGDFGLVTSRMLLLIVISSIIVSMLRLIKLKNKNELQTCFPMYYLLQINFALC